MKKIIVIAMLSALCVIGLVGCGDADMSTSIVNNESVTETPIASTIIENFSSEATSFNTIENTATAGQNSVIGDLTQSSKIVLLDSNGIYVEMYGLDRRSENSIYFDLYIENNRDSEERIYIDNLIINGYAISFANTHTIMQPHSKFVSVSNNRYVITTSDLINSNIQTIESLRFDIDARHSLFDDPFAESHVDVKYHLPIE